MEGGGRLVGGCWDKYINYQAKANTTPEENKTSWETEKVIPAQAAGPRQPLGLSPRQPQGVLVQPLSPGTTGARMYRSGCECTRD